MLFIGLDESASYSSSAKGTLSGIIAETKDENTFKAAADRCVLGERNVWKQRETDRKKGDELRRRIRTDRENGSCNGLRGKASWMRTEVFGLASVVRGAERTEAMGGLAGHR